MKILVVYDSVFGNTEQIARAIGAALAGAGEAQVLRVTAVNSSHLAGVDLLIVGSPTRGFAPTVDIVDWLNNLPKGVFTGARAAAFDTRIDTRDLFILWRLIVDGGGYAVKRIEPLLTQNGAVLAAPGAGFFVIDRQGPLKPGELERASAWAKTLLT